MKKTLLLPIGLFGLVIGLLCGLPIIAVISTEYDAAACDTRTGATTASHVDNTATGPVGKWSKKQATHAFTIAAAGKEKGIPARGWVIAVATAIQESSLKNLANPAVPESANHPNDGKGNDHDSVGLFQQRPSQGWGTVTELMNPHQSASKFYDRLTKIPNWETKPLGQTAQAVQKSAFPDKYDRWEKDAESLVTTAARANSITNIDGASLIQCTTTNTVSQDGWTPPVKAPIVSAFRTSGRPDHNGVDLGAPRNTAIHAAATGKVITVICNSSNNNCDIDGGTNIRGCGWYVDIRHNDGIVTRYCHMIRKPEVTEGQQVQAGQTIGYVGSSGNSSGPHLHFEIHKGVSSTGRPTKHNAIDPVTFMKNQGAPLN